MFDAKVVWSGLGKGVRFLVPRTYQLKHITLIHVFTFISVKRVTTSAVIISEIGTFKGSDPDLGGSFFI